ncbi:MAG: UbiX family flavin prenyltransferase [bacterium]
MKENLGIGRPSFVLAVTGASGAIYGFSLLKALISRSFFVYLIISKPGFKVIKDELGMFADILDVYIDGGTTLPSRAPLLEKDGSAEVKAGRYSLNSFNLRIKDEIVNKFGLHEYSDRFAFLDENFLEASIASGSAKNVKGMIVIPCSMGSLSRIANGNSGNLIERAADVMLKERKKLIVCPRETPFNDIHLKNMLSLYASGAVILPPVPAFYNKPLTVDDIIDFITGRILDSLDIENDIYKRWKGHDSK